MIPAGAVGVDVSHWQGTINYQQAKADGVSWVSAKVTQGRHYIDPKGHTNLTRAAQAGLAVVGYHFAQPSETPHPSSAVLEAEHYADSYVSGPAVLDWEATSDPRIPLDQVPAYMQVAWITAWVTWWDEHVGVETVVYCDRAIARLLATAATTQGVQLPSLWIANWVGHLGATPADAPAVGCYQESNEFTDGPWGNPIWWQWADQGHVDGMGLGVDLDLAL